MTLETIVLIIESPFLALLFYAIATDGRPLL